MMVLRTTRRVYSKSVLISENPLSNYRIISLLMLFKFIYVFRMTNHHNNIVFFKHIIRIYIYDSFPIMYNSNNIESIFLAEFNSQQRFPISLSESLISDISILSLNIMLSSPPFVSNRLAKRTAISCSG